MTHAYLLLAASICLTPALGQPIRAQVVAVDASITDHREQPHDLFQHLVADVDSAPPFREEYWPPTLPVLVDSRTLATGPHHPDSAFNAVPDNVTRARIAAIQRVGLDTATTPPSSTCQGNLPDVPDAGRKGCPASARVIYAFSDALELTTAQADDTTNRRWLVIVQQAYLRPNGSTIAGGRYIVSRGATGWRTVSRQLVGFAH